MRKSASVFCLITLVSFMSGCGSSTPEPEMGVDLPDRAGVALFNQRNARAQMDYDAFVSFAEPFRSVDDLPSFGKVEYDGYVGFRTQGNTGYVGNMNIEVDFNAIIYPVSGSADDFVSSEGERFTGTLNISNSSIAEGSGTYGPGFRSSLDGTLVGPTTGSLSVDTNLIGEFGSEKGLYGRVVGIGADLDGTITTDQGSRFAVTGGLIAID